MKVLKVVHYYINKNQSAPFLKWFESLENAAQIRIRNRINRVAFGNFGRINKVGKGVHELKFKDKGFPTFRVYFGNDGPKLIILLLGGDKSNQQADIKLAQEYWYDYQQNK